MQNQDQQQPSYSQQSGDQQFKPSEGSYVGIKDWLRTFVILFALQAASDIYSLFSSFANPIGGMGSYWHYLAYYFGCNGDICRSSNFNA